MHSLETDRETAIKRNHAWILYTALTWKKKLFPIALCFYFGNGDVYCIHRIHVYLPQTANIRQRFCYTLQVYELHDFFHNKFNARFLSISCYVLTISFISWRRIPIRDRTSGYNCHVKWYTWLQLVWLALSIQWYCSVPMNEHECVVLWTKKYFRHDETEFHKQKR